MNKLICEYLSKFDAQTKSKILLDAQNAENSAEITSLIAALCAELRLNKYDKGIHQIIKNEIIKTDSIEVVEKKPKKEKVIRSSVSNNEQVTVSTGRKSFFNF